MKYAVLMVGLVILFTGCMKKERACTPKSPASEEAQIKSYIATNNINAIKHSSGLYYEIVNPGSGVNPTQTSNLEVTYTGRFMSGATFEQTNTPVVFNLGGVIEGWQIGLPLIKKGGKIRLIIPSAYAYGCNDYSGIPGNSVLDFDIDLIDVR